MFNKMIFFYLLACSFSCLHMLDNPLRKRAKHGFFCQLFSDRFLPDKAIDLIDEAGSRVRLRHAQVLVEISVHHLLFCLL